MQQRSHKTPDQYFAQVRASLDNPATVRRMIDNGAYNEVLDLLTILTTPDPRQQIDDRAMQAAIDYGALSPQYNVWFFAQKALGGFEL
jgi:hypothetical protein